MNTSLRLPLMSAIVMTMVVTGAACTRPTESDEEFGSNVADNKKGPKLGGALPGIKQADFQEASDAFNAVEEIEDGLGPIFNEKGCGNCHNLGAQGGAGEQ